MILIYFQVKILTENIETKNTAANASRGNPLKGCKEGTKVEFVYFEFFIPLN
jgi:hypothetical protein